MKLAGAYINDDTHEKLVARARARNRTLAGHCRDLFNRDLREAAESANHNPPPNAMPSSEPAATQPPVAELLTQGQMAARLGITRRTLHAWVQDGKVPMIKIKGFCRFDPAKVWAALQLCEVAKEDAK